MAEMVKSFPTEGTDVTPSRRGATSGQEQPGDVTGRVASDAKQVAAQAKDLVSNQVTERAGRSATDILQVARALRQSRRDLGDNAAAPYVDKAADQLERFSRFLRDKSPGDVVRDVESFARREPLLFLGGAFALGMLGARFLKSSARHGEERGWSTRERDQRDQSSRSRTDWTSPSRTGQREDRSFVATQSGYSGGGYSQGSYSQGGSSQRDYSRENAGNRGIEAPATEGTSGNGGRASTTEGGSGNGGRSSTATGSKSGAPGQPSSSTSKVEGGPGRGSTGGTGGGT